MEPEQDVPFHILREITDDFSKDRKLGEGAFGVVYKGVTRNGADVAVKMLRSANLDYKQFQNEFYNLRKLKHQNIVEVLGYCYETKKNPFVMPNGSTMLVDETYQALCLEYLHNGSLQEHLSDELCGLDWGTRFRIVKGICEGLKYIHEELEEPIYHLDLKPDNILLDEDMLPKIADFGLSRIFGKKELTRTTQSPYGTLGYQPPEYIDNGEISEKFDIFSLGVIMIRIVSGPKGYPRCMDTPSDEFIDNVRRNWTNRLQAICSSDSSLETYCHQIKTCMQIAFDCVQKDSHKRPNIVNITEKLNKVENNIAKLPQKGFHKAVAGMTMYNKKIEKRKESKDITAQHRDFNLMTGPNHSDLEFFDALEATPDVVEELIVGRTEEKGKIIASLFQGMSEKITILPIYGIGGIGKTTLARLIYDDTNFTCYSQVWVNVSQRFELNKILESIVLQLSGKEGQANVSQMIHSCLAKLLSGKKILIVLDNLWEDNQFQLQELKDMLYHDNSNIIIIVTTRSERVADRICTNIQPYKISPLTDDMCWDIIKQRSGFEARNDKEQLAGIGQEIARKCGGVPLAARSLGFTLRSMNFYHWTKVKDTDLWNEPVSNDVALSNHVLASLKLSYNYMPLCLKPCFTYCAMFPKGHKIVKNDLIYQWISSGFINPTKILSNIQLCENFIVQLLGLSFFQRSVSPKSTGVYHEDDTVFSMHDLVHDLARLVLVDEILDTRKERIPGGSTIHFELLDDCTESLKAFTQYPTKITALSYLESKKTVRHGASSSSAKFLSFRVYGKIGLRDDVFSAAKYLRVLDLTECTIRNLPDSVGNLKQLRYLNAPRVQHRAIPNRVTELSKLIYLNLSGSSNILALPESIGQMEGLMYLDFSGCARLQKLPVSFGKLTKLVHLDVSDCPHLTGVSESLECLINLEYLNLSGCLRIGELPEYLGSLLQLRNLNFSYSSYVEGRLNTESFVALTKLECLNLASSKQCVLVKKQSNFLSRLTNVKYLNLSCCHGDILNEGPKAFANLKNLVYLDLSECSRVNGILETLGSLTKLQYLNFSKSSWLRIGAKLEPSHLSKAMGNLTELRYLNLSNCSCYYYVRDEAFFTMFLECISNIPNLEHLDLSGNGNLTSLPDCLCNLRKLHTLDLSGCILLERLPANLNEMDSLKFLVLERSSLLEFSEQPLLNKSLVTLPHFVVQAHCHDFSSSLVLLQDVNRTDLVISKLENVKSVQEAEMIELKKKLRMKDMKLNWTKDAERFVEDVELLGELVPPNTLEKLRISGYNSVRLPEWFFGIASHLPNLVRISMSNLSMCNSLPPFGQLPNLRKLVLEQMDSISRIDWDICGTKRPWFPRLQFFSLRQMKSLQVWYTIYSWNGDGVSEFMFPILRVLEIHDCPNLRLVPCPHKAEERWGIYGRNDGVISSLGEGSSQASVSSPFSAPVTTMGIYSCEVPMHLWRLLHHLPALTKLKIRRCSDLRSSPEITQALSCLQSLSLDSLPEIMQELCSLQSLTLPNWDQPEPELPSWLGQLASLKKLKIQWYKVKALQDSMGHLTRLQSLRLEYITSMTALPGWVGELISLQQLKITSCLNLNDLTESIGGLTSLYRLEIRHCDGITSLPDSLKQLTKLEKLGIFSCHNLNDLTESFGGLTSLNELVISNCNGITSLPESIRGLTSLNELVISNCNGITSLPESIGGLTSLNEVEISHCNGITSLPESIGGLTSLKKLGIFSCNGITSLPRSMQQLTKLEQLTISLCKELGKWCQTEENETKLAHIKQKESCTSFH